MIIGITGGTGSGKTTLLKLLEEHGFAVLDCDAIYHQLLQTDKSLLDAIEARFPGVVQSGELQRKKLGAMVFADPAALADLNRITHSAVKAEVLRLLEQCPENTAIDAIGLFESGLSELCKLTIAVTAPLNARIQRLMHREGISEKYARARISAQRPQEDFVCLCDHTLENNGTEAEFREKCLAFLKYRGILNL